MAHEQSFHHSDVENDEHIDPEVMKGGEGISQESEHSETSKEPKSGGNVGEGEEDLASDGSLLGKEEAGDHTIEFRNLGNESSLKTFGDLCKTSTSNGMVTKAVDYKSDLALELGDFDALEASQRAEIAAEREATDHEELHGGGSSPEVVSRDFFSSESRHNAENNKQFHYVLEESNVAGFTTGVDFSNSASSSKNNDCKTREQIMSLESLKPAAISASNGEFDLDLNTDVGSEDLDCVLCLVPSTAVDLSAPTVACASNGTPGLPVIPLYSESELGLRISAYVSSFQRASLRMSDSKQREKFVEIDINMSMHPPLVEEEEEAPPLLQLSSSMQPSVRGIDLNNDPCAFDSVPVLATWDSRMIIDKMDELSTRAFIRGMEDSTPSCPTWIPDLNLDYGMMQIENGGSEEGSVMHLFMPESGNLLGEERKGMKRKEPDSGFEPYDSVYDQLRLKL